MSVCLSAYLFVCLSVCRLDLFGTLDPFGSSSFSSGSNSTGGFADFSQMSKTRDLFEGRAGWLPDYQKVPSHHHYHSHVSTRLASHGAAEGYYIVRTVSAVSLNYSLFFFLFPVPLPPIFPSPCLCPSFPPLLLPLLLPPILPPLLPPLLPSPPPLLLSPSLSPPLFLSDRKRTRLTSSPL